MSFAHIGPISIFILLQVVIACYGNDLRPDYEEKIEEFRAAFMDLGVRVTPKIHAVLHHVKEFCSFKQAGLGKWSEQAGEALHHDFLNVWENYKTRSTKHADFGERLLRATCAYNGRHT